MYFKDITIDNFRGIDHLEVKEFAPINIFVGGNNIGKSSILEAIFLLSGMSNLPLVATLNGRRGIPTLELQDSLRYVFHNLSLEKYVSIKGSTVEGIRILTLTPKFKEAKSSLLDPRTSSSAIEHQEDLLIGLKSEYGFKDQRMFENEFSIENDDITFTPTPDYKETTICKFLNIVQRANESMRDEFDKLLSLGIEGELIEYVKLFSPDITDLVSTRTRLLASITGVHGRLPLAMLGDGTSQFLGIITAILTIPKGNVAILIDEIENGLHYTAQRKLWRILLKVVKETELQLFITTHSIEALQSLTEEIADAGLDDDFMSLYRIAMTKLDGLQAYRYNTAGIRTAIENETELRK